MGGNRTDVAQPRGGSGGSAPPMLELHPGFPVYSDPSPLTRERLAKDLSSSLPMPSTPALSALLLLLSVVATTHSLAGERSAPARSNTASTVLIETASQQYADGKLDQAAATLERALHIQPNNPATLHYLGVLRLQQGQFEQAETLALRSNLRVGANHALRNRNLQLIEAAHNAQRSGMLPTAAH